MPLFNLNAEEIAHIQALRALQTPQRLALMQTIANRAKHRSSRLLVPVNGKVVRLQQPK